MASSSFVGLGVISTDYYINGGSSGPEWYLPQVISLFRSFVRMLNILSVELLSPNSKLQHQYYQYKPKCLHLCHTLPRYANSKSSLSSSTKSRCSPAFSFHSQKAINIQSVAQATSIQNVLILASTESGTTQQGICEYTESELLKLRLIGVLDTENGSGGFMTDMVFFGGNFGLCKYCH